MKKSVWFLGILTAIMLAVPAMASKESCGLDDRFDSPRDFKDSRAAAEREAGWNCNVLGKGKAARVSAWRDRHSDGADCQRDSITGDCVPGSMMYAPVNQSCAEFVCK